MDEHAGDIADGTARDASDEVLRESVRARSSQTSRSVAGLVVVTVAFVAALQEVSAWRVLAWMLPLLLGVSWRLVIARRAARLLHCADANAVRALDRQLLVSSVVNQTAVGAGIWTVGTASASSTPAAFVTIAIALYLIGVMINLSSDYRSFRISLPFIMVQPIVYWSLHGLAGAGIAVSLCVLSLLMLSAVRRSADTFRESVLIRRDKDTLLGEIKRQHAAVQDALGRAEAANRSKAAFMAAASHDLRQPLYAISILAETALVHELAAAPRELLENQLQAIRVLRGLFDNLLDLSRFDTGGVQPIYRPVPLRELLGPLDLEIRTLCEAKKLAWRCGIADAWVLTDADLMQRMVRNLLSNAVRYTETGSVTLQAAVEGAEIVVRVADTGPGIAPDAQQRIFDEFVQLDNPQRDRERGVGLGLSIVKRIDALLEAGLALDSAVGKGTTFTLRMPRIAAAHEAAEDGAVAPAAADLDALRVWVVEDDPLVRSALATQLAAWRCDCTALTGRQGVFEARSMQGGWPDAMILDDMLGPRESGLDLAREIAPDIGAGRMLLMTGNASPERIAELRRSGCGFLAKPASASALRGWLTAVQEKARAEEAAALE